MTNLDSILKSRDITLQTKVHVVKVMTFPVVMCGCESWSIKKAERQRIYVFELWCWRRLLRVPWAARVWASAWGGRRIDAFKLWCYRRLLRVAWTARRSNQSILKGINPEYSLEAEAEVASATIHNLQYFGHLMRRADSLEKTLMLGKIEGRRRTG